MNNTYILLMLVNTLTKAEKRYFHLCANLQNGDKVYLTLFNLIDANTSPRTAVYTLLSDSRREEFRDRSQTFISGTSRMFS